MAAGGVGGNDFKFVENMRKSPLPFSIQNGIYNQRHKHTKKSLNMGNCTNRITKLHADPPNRLMGDVYLAISRGSEGVPEQDNEIACQVI